MKKLGTILAAFVVTALVASAAQASISGTAHDFGTLSWSGNQICQPCHTPHFATIKDADGKVLEGPLWNHTLSSATYTLYLDLDGTTHTGKVDQNSKLCLSCHDGTVALDSFGGAVGTNFIAADATIGTDLSNDHPIGENAVWPTGASYMVDPTYRSGKGIMPLRTLDDGRSVVGCTSCHEPHNRKNNPKLLWAPISGAYTTVDSRAVSGSGLCMNCHKK